MKTYVGRREGQAVIVTVDGESLNPRLDLWNHSPSGFELALALLADTLGEDDKAVEWHQDFKAQVVAGLPFKGWALTEAEIRETIEAFENA